MKRTHKSVMVKRDNAKLLIYSFAIPQEYTFQESWKDRTCQVKLGDSWPPGWRISFNPPEENCLKRSIAPALVSDL